MKSELGRYKEALQYALKELERMHRSSGQRVRADVDAILNPPPEMEAVKVERWECKTCGTMFKSQVVSAGNSCCWGADTLIPLTGTFQRPKPQPVEKSESIHGVQINQAGRFLRYDSPVIEFPSAKGKTVTLTVTWEETP